MITKALLSNKQVFLEMIRYFLGALAAISFDWATWLILTWFGLEPIRAQAISRALGGIAAFFIYKNYTFKNAESNSQTWHQALKFILLVAFSWCVSILIFTLLQNYMPAYLAKILTDGFTFITNYFLTKFVVF